MRTVVLAGLFASACASRDPDPASRAAGQEELRSDDDDLALPSGHAAEARDEALSRARVWRPPAQALGDVDFRRNPPGEGSFSPAEEVHCTFQLKASEGRTPKFYCVLPGGEVVKVKYGRRNAEPWAEVAATRLLSALGFGADRMYVVARVRCLGCPPYPLPRFAWLDALFSREGHTVDFAPAAVERPFPGKKIALPESPGWSWDELDKMDPARGGASRAERDALRLIAVFLADWDNKPANQRLVCLPGGVGPDGTCREPFAFLQDVGATFGPRGVRLEAWRALPVWADPATCRVSMKGLPYGGATFEDTEISDGGRRLLAAELKQLRDEQVRDLFDGAGFAGYARGPDSNRDVSAWVEAFQAKVSEIADRPPCPTP
jgi:hypothetical protein